MHSNQEIKKMTRSSKIFGPIALLALVWPAIGQSQEGGWRHTITPYLMAAHLEGTSGIGGLNADIDLNASDIFSNLDFGAMLAYRGETEDWAVMTDFIYMKLGASQTSSGENLYARVNLEQTTAQLDVARRLSEHFEITLGARYWDVETTLQLTGLGPVGIDVRGEAGDSWIDPLLGMRVTYPFNDRWAFLGKGDIGGFGIGSDFTWHATAALNWAASERTSVTLLYRHIAVDYESGSGASRFALDITEAGPGMGVSFKF
jgi:hypothetical protein